MENELIKSLLGMAEIMESLGDLPKAKTIRSAADTLEKQTAEIQRLNSCVKSEDEVRAIMQACMKTEASKLVKKEAKEQTDAAYVLGIHALALRLIQAFNANLNTGTEAFPYDSIREIITECSDEMIEEAHHG